MEQRVQKILAEAGIASRRKAEELIAEGRVTINGKTAIIGSKADPDKDHIKVDGKLLIRKSEPKVYFMFNKPKGVVTSLSDPEGRPTIKDFLGKIRFRVFPVGRLDYDSEGLLLLTNDGDFANAVSHPSGEIAKTYYIKVKGLVEQKNIEKLRRGIRLEDGKTMPARVQKISSTENNSWLDISISEGRKRQVRRMLEAVGHPVLKLKRISIDGLNIGKLKPGEIKPLSSEELKLIKSSCRAQVSSLRA